MSGLIQKPTDKQVKSEDGESGSLWTTVAGFIARLRSSAGAALVGFIQAGAGAVLRTLQDKAREVVSVKDFGAVGDGVTSDYAAFVAAYTAHPGETIYIPDPAVGYKIDGLLTLPPGTILKGQTRQKTKILHAYNGDFAKLESGSGFMDCWIDGQGETYTGRCFVFEGVTGQQIRSGVRASNFDGEIEEFEVDAGSQSLAIDVRYARRNAGTGTNRFAVVIETAQKLSAVTRKFIGYESDGTCSFDFGGCNNVYIASSFMGDLKYTPDSRAVFITGSRVANQMELTVDGHNNTIVGCDLSPKVTIAPGADAIAIQGNVYNKLPVIDLSNNGRNMIDHWATTYTPTLTSGGTVPVLGDGQITGRVSRSGSTVRVTIELTVGATTTLGTGDIRFSLPTFAPNYNEKTQYCGFAVITRGSTNYTASIQVPQTLQFARLIRDTSGSVTFNSPAIWEAGDLFRLTFEYDVG